MRNIDFVKILNAKILNILLSLNLLFTGCGSPDNYEELSGEYLYTGGDGDEIIDRKPNGMDIHGKVVRYKFDNNFIIALQKPGYETHKVMIAFNLRSDTKRYPENSDKDINVTQELADSILQNDPYYQKIFSSKDNYWIISHKNEKVYGPFNKGDYKLKRIELHIPEGLQLE